MKLIVNDRVMAIDVKFGDKCIRIFSVYVPHAGYTWNEFIVCFDQIAILIDEAIDKRFGILMGGDFNLVLNHAERGIFL